MDADQQQLPASQWGPSFYGDHGASPSPTRRLVASGGDFPGAGGDSTAASASPSPSPVRHAFYSPLASPSPVRHAFYSPTASPSPTRHLLGGYGQASTSPVRQLFAAPTAPQSPAWGGLLPGGAPSPPQRRVLSRIVATLLLFTCFATLGLVLIGQAPFASLLQPSGSGGDVSLSFHASLCGSCPAANIGSGGISSSISGGMGAAASSMRSSSTCNLKVEPSPFAQSCTLLRDVCVDQRTIILHGSEYQPGPNKEPPREPPVLAPTTPHQQHYIFLYKNNSGRSYQHSLPPIEVRPASINEPTPYLSQPSFSTCTVPIIWYPHWAQNAAHMFRDNAARLHTALLETEWADHAKLVLMTADGLAPPRFDYDILQPLTPLQVETWADFTNRLPARPAPAGGFEPAPVEQRMGGPMPSSEGSPQRCFRQMFVCTNDIQIQGLQLHAYGRRMVQYYRQQGSLTPAELQQQQHAAEQLKRQVPHQAQLPPPEALQRRLGLAAAAGGAGSSSSSKEEQHALRIAFHKRNELNRQLLNSAELLERCNSWQYTTTGGQRLRAECWEVEFSDTFTGMAAAQTADIFVGAHGANMVNAWFMRPGSSVIELTPHGFDEARQHIQYALHNMQDRDTQVQNWILMLCDPNSWTPGEQEAAGVGPERGYTKDRNMIVRWEALERAFREVVDTAGDMEQYRQRWEEGRWFWFDTGKEVVYGGPHRHVTCQRALQVGIIPKDSMATS